MQDTRSDELVTGEPFIPVTYTRRAEFWAGFRATIPLVIGGIPFGLIFGAYAVTSGISPAGAIAMSLFVFAGSAEFIAAGLVASGVGVMLIILTTLVVNLRHALYSASLAPHMKHLSQRWLVPLAFWLTDETFAVVIAHYTKPDKSPYKHWFYLGSAVFMYVDWQISTLIGVLAGQSIPREQVLSLGLDFAGMLTFIGLTVPLIRTRPMLVTVIVAIICSIVFYNPQTRLELVIAPLLGVIAGMVAESQLKRVKSATVTSSTEQAQ